MDYSRDAISLENLIHTTQREIRFIKEYFFENKQQINALNFLSKIELFPVSDNKELFLTTEQKEKKAMN